MFNSRGSKHRSTKVQPKNNYAYKPMLYDLSLSRSSLEQQLGITKVKDPVASTLPEKIKSNASFSLDRLNNNPISTAHNSASITKKSSSKPKDFLHLPKIKQSITNPEQKSQQRVPQPFYQSKVYRGLKNRENTYMMNLARQHFLQTVEAIKIGKKLKINPPAKEIKLSKKNPKLKTIFLDMDETLIHCDETATNYTIKLNFPIEGGSTIQAGIRVRPYCEQFLKQLSEFAEIIIFTASSSSYADVVLDYLDPHKKLFAHRLYRQHCTLEQGFYTKDLRIVNRRPQDVAIVDNSAFSFMTQPEFGIPILPYYHFAKDKQLQSLIPFLKKLVEEPDMRQKIKEVFLWEKYLKSEEDPRKVILNYYKTID